MASWAVYVLTTVVAFLAYKFFSRDKKRLPKDVQLLIEIKLFFNIRIKHLFNLFPCRSSSMAISWKQFGIYAVPQRTADEMA